MEERLADIREDGILHESVERREAVRSHVRRRLPKDEVRREYEEKYAACAAAIESAIEDRRRSLDSVLGSGLAGHLELEPVQLDPETLEVIEGTALDAGGLNVVLRRYQEFGAKFMLAQERTIVGDEMGLGKTIQALAAMAQIWSERGPSHFLVVAPAGLLGNWMHEIAEKAFFPALLGHGSEREDSLETWLERGGVLVTSYSTLRSLPVADRLRSAEQAIDLLVVDEAHFAKNPEALRTRAIADVVRESRRIGFLSGTPMENHPREFARLIRLLEPRTPFALTDEELENPHSGRVSRAFREGVVELYLRRNQKDVLLELPEKIEVAEWVHLDHHERVAYEAAVASGNFMAMRQAVTCPPPHTSSAKLERLEALLEEHRAHGRKVIVFSYFLRVLEEVGLHAGAVGMISGRVSLAERERILEEFRTRPGHRLLPAQITAAGQGLNLQEASVVILMEPQLTPGAEAQAIARAHRMGQTNPVFVHRLLAENTVDERLVEILAEKKVLFDEYARRSLAKERNPEATATSLARRIVDLEQQRLGIQPTPEGAPQASEA
jgi:SNF2 family DNA or RNA helicase